MRALSSICARGELADPPNHLFRLVAAAYETRSLVVTSNWGFELWTNLLPDATTATAILDRLLHPAWWWS